MSTFIVVLTVPETTNDSEQLKKLLENLVEVVKGGGFTGIVVDDTALSKKKNFNEITEPIGPWARKELDPKLYSLGIKKIAFISPTGKFPGRDEEKAKGGPIQTAGAPTKHYFQDMNAAITWLRI